MCSLPSTLQALCLPQSVLCSQCRSQDILQWHCPVTCHSGVSRRQVCFIWAGPPEYGRCPYGCGAGGGTVCQSTEFTHWEPVGVLGLYMFVSFFFFCFLGPHPRHMEVPRLGVQSELELLAYTTVTATRDPSHICDNLQQHWILDPLGEARVRTQSSQILVGFISAEP